MYDIFKKTENKYDPKVEVVKYLEVIDQNKIWLTFNTASKVCKFPEHAPCRSIFNTFLSNFGFLKYRH